MEKQNKKTKNSLPKYSNFNGIKFQKKAQKNEPRCGCQALFVNLFKSPKCWFSIKNKAFI